MKLNEKQLQLLLIILRDTTMINDNLRIFSISSEDRVRLLQEIIDQQNNELKDVD